MLNFFKVYKLFSKLKNGNLDRQSFDDQLRNIDQPLWEKLLDPKTIEIYRITKDFNNGFITKDEYKDAIRSLDKDRWVAALSAEELVEHNLHEKFINGDISEIEYRKELATLDGVPFIGVKNIEVKPDGFNMIEFEWNSIFIDQLRKKGYTATDDTGIIDRWFVGICTLIAAEADTVIVNNPEDIRNATSVTGKTEYS